MLDELNLLTNKINDVKNKSDILVNIMDNIVKAYTADLDNIMTNINKDIVLVENPALDTLEKYFFELSNQIYFMNERVESVGIQNDLSKLIMSEAFNNAYLNHKNSNNGVTGAKKPTDSEANTIAENETIEESTINSLYNRTYKVIKGKIDNAQTMIASISKIISLRSQEMQLSQIQPNAPITRQILNENEFKF